MTQSTGLPAYFALPPGFTPLDLSLDEQRLQASTASLRESVGAEFGRLLDAAIAANARQFDAFRAAGISFAAVGAHPRPDGGVDLSSLTATVRTVPEFPDVGLLASLAMAESEQPGTTKAEIRTFPAGKAVVAERRQKPAPFGELEDRLPGVDRQAAPLPILTIRVGFPLPEPGRLFVVELSTQVASAWESYRNVMLGIIAKSVTFVDPVEQAAAASHASAKVESLRARLG